MVSSALALHSAVLGLAAVANGAIASFAYRRREIPGATPFTALTACLSVWSLTYGLGLHVVGAEMRLLLLRVQWIAIPFITVSLFLFAAAYTGTDEFVDWRSLTAILLIPVFTVFATWTNPWHQLFWTQQRVRVSDGMALLDPSFGPLFWVYTIYSYTLVAVSVALIVRLTYQSEYLYTDQSVSLLLGIGAPFAINIVDVFVLAGGPNVDYTPVALTVTGLAFGYALFRQQLFDLIPATRKIGRDAAIRQLDTGVIIVDSDRRVVYFNGAAGELFDCEPSAALGREVGTLVADDAIDFDTDDALAELERGDAVYEVRTSEIADRSDRLIGYTLIIHDVTARKERERELARQRDELAELNELNAVIRGVNQALVSARSREEIEQTVCNQVADSDLYRTVCIGDVATWTGTADRWTIANSADAGAVPPAVEGDGSLISDTKTADRTDPTMAIASDGGDWTVVPITYGRTVYGALGLHTDREAVGEREGEILAELGDLIGHAINGVETRQLLAGDSAVRVELAVRDEADPLVAVASEFDCEVQLEGIVPSGDEGPVAYIQLSDADPEAVREALAARGVETRVVRASADDDGGLLEWQVTGETPLGAIFDHGANINEALATERRARYEFDIAESGSVRRLVDHLRERFGEVQLLSKQERPRADQTGDELPEAPLENLTDRQREVLEAAYQAGYFNWPRDSNAEEIAESLDIASATLHDHLRKAEGSLLADLFEAADRDSWNGSDSQS